MNVTIVEDEKSYEEFVEVWKGESSLIIPIFIDIFKHPSNQNGLSFLFLRTEMKIFIIPYNHTDCVRFNDILPPSNQKKYVWDKKSFLQTNLGVDNLYDINTYQFFNEHKDPIIDLEDLPLVRHYKRFNINDNIGSVLPIFKWVEYLEKATNEIDLSSFPDNQLWVDSEMIPILSEVEKKGIRVDTNKYSNTKYSTKHLNGDILYTKYNPYTITSRPSNTYGGINFSALSKKGNIREMFIPREDNVFVQFDYDAYHVRIIGKMIDYELPSSSVHEWLADVYNVGYDESKKITFRILYGGVPDEYKNIKFFKEVNTFIHSLDKKDEITTLKKRVIKKSEIDNPNSLKLFNYLLQAMETEFNMSVLMLLKEVELPLPVLYTYDSFLFDIPKDKKLVLDIKEVLEEYNFPVKMTAGLNYSEV